MPLDCIARGVVLGLSLHSVLTLHLYHFDLLRLWKIEWSPVTASWHAAASARFEYKSAISQKLLNTMDTNSFTHLQNARRSRSKSSIWRAKDVESETLDEAASRRTSIRSSVMSVADQWAQARPRDSADTSRISLDRQSSSTSISKKGLEIRRWDGAKRATAPWDEIRRVSALQLVVKTASILTSALGP